MPLPYPRAVTLNWRGLVPHLPLSPAEIRAGGLYVDRPYSGAAELERLLASDSHKNIVLFGPAGSGKSTELAMLAFRLHANRSIVTAHIQIDRSRAFSQAVSPDDVLAAVRTLLIEELATTLDLSSAKGSWAHPSPLVDGQDVAREGSTVTLRRVCLAASSIAGKGGLVVLLDGLEKANDLARSVLAAFQGIPEARFVVVVPTTLGLAETEGRPTPKTSPGVRITTLQHQTKSIMATNSVEFVPVEPVLVNASMEGHSGLRDLAEEGVRFLVRIAQQRLNCAGEHLDGSLDQMMRTAALLSGGLVRTFLQLLQDAANYAMMADANVPSEGDFHQAAQDYAYALCRLLLPGDVDALSTAHGTDGSSLEFERRVRLLDQGLLFQYRSAGNTVAIAPLLGLAIPALQGVLNG